MEGQAHRIVFFRCKSQCRVVLLYIIPKDLSEDGSMRSGGINKGEAQTTP